MFRILAFSLLMVCALAVTLPVAESQAGLGKGAKSSWNKKRKQMTRRQRIAYQRRRRAAIRRRRMMARLRRQQEAAKLGGAIVNTNAKPGSSVSPNRVTPYGATHFATPAGWNGVGRAGDEMRWQVAAARGNVSFAPLGLAGADEHGRRRYRTLGGYPHADLRRQAIDRMVAEGGWVINDTERVVGGHPTLVVHAASGDRSAPRQWVFYFTVADNRLYRFVADAPGDNVARITAEIDSVVASLRAPAPAALTARADGR